MAFTAMLRRSASVVPLAIRAVSMQREVHGSALSAAIKHSCGGSRHICRSLFPSVLHYSSRPSSDESLLELIELEIEEDEDPEEVDWPVEQQFEEIRPVGSPFKLEDNPGQQIATLTRKFRGETIRVQVHMFKYIPDENICDFTGSGNYKRSGLALTREYQGETRFKSITDENDITNLIAKIPLIVSVRKRTGHILKFSCTYFLDEISINDLSVKDPEADPKVQFVPYESRKFADLGKNLQKAILKYLEIRRIRPSELDFLTEYLAEKHDRQRRQWWKKVKGFIEA